jgi:hypothetical protein
MLRPILRKLTAKFNNISRSRKLIFLATFFVFCGLLFLPGSSARAQGTIGVGTAVTFVGNVIITPILYVIKVILFACTTFFTSLIVFVLTFIIELAAYNGYLSSTAVNLGWVMVRDLTNMVFVVIMLVIAFATILGIEEYGWKHLLFKMIGMAILVNFSRTICGLVIDMAQVVMITFVNGVAATATSSVISAFGLDKLGSLNPQFALTGAADIQIFISYAAAFFLSLTILLALGGYIGMLVGRVVYLWVLIVLSPIAFVFSVLHETHHYAEEWRSEFIKQVITGPVLIFFLWLTFATIGNGSIAAEISKGSSAEPNQKVTSQLDGQIQNSGIGQILRWDMLANYLIAIAMLLIGLKTAGHLGGFGAEFVEHHALGVGKEVTSFLTGATLAKHVGTKAWEGAGEAKDWALHNMPLGGKFWERQGKNIKNKVNMAYNKNWVEPGLEAASGRVDRAYGKYSEDTYKKDEHDNFVLDENGNKILLGKKDEFTTKSGWNRLAAKVGIAVLGPSALKEEMSHDLEAAAEASNESLTHIASTSKTPGGVEKARAKQRLEEHEKTGVKIKQVKQAIEEDRRDRIIEIMDDKTKSDQEKRKLLGSEGLDDNDIARFEFDRKRRDKARESEVQAHVKNEARETEEERRASRYKEKYLHSQEGHTLEHKIAEHTAERTQIEDKLSAEKQTGLLLAIRDLLASQAGMTRQRETASLLAGNKQQEDRIAGVKERQSVAALKELMISTAGRAEQARINRTRAQTEIEKSVGEDFQIISQAEQKAKVFESKGDISRAEATRKSAAVQVDKKFSDLFSNLSYDQRMAQEAVLIRKIESETDPDRKTTLQKMRVNLTSLNTSSDNDSARDGRARAATELGVTEIDDGNRLTLELQRLTGARGVTNLADLKRQFDGIYGTDAVSKKLAMEKLFESYKKAAGRGDEFGLGLMKKEVDPNTGSLSYEWAADDATAENLKETNYGTYFAERAKGNADSAGTMGGKMKQTPQGSWVMNGVSKSGRASLVAFHKGKDAREMSTRDMTPWYASFNSAEVSMANINEYLDLMYEMKKTMPEKGYNTFKENTKGLQKKITDLVGISDPFVQTVFG